MNARRRVAIAIVASLAAIVAFVVAGISTLHGDDTRRVAATNAAAYVPKANATPEEAIAGLQSRLAAVPADYGAWASLGLAYITAAKVTANPTYYAKAQGALRRSLRVQPTDNFLAAAGLSALAAARHDFTHARMWAKKGLAIDAASAVLYGALADAETQLGNYDAAFAATQKMIDLRPDTASFARVSYAWELRGDIKTATNYMQRAVDAAPSPTDESFARYYLGELAFNAGDPTTALAQHTRALSADPKSLAAREGKAKAEAALGQTDAALRDFADLVTRVPQPNYLLEYGDLLESLGRHADAAAQYKLFETEQKLFGANGVAADVDATLFYADHGDPRRALELGRAGIQTRPFLEMQDAYAWALHANNRDTEALEWSNKALALGMQNALLYFHRGMIERSLGDEDAARDDLAHALRINASFNALAAPLARAALQGSSQ